jgi:hypothetical protein
MGFWDILLENDGLAWSMREHQPETYHALKIYNGPPLVFSPSGIFLRDFRRLDRRKKVKWGV